MNDFKATKGVINEYNRVSELIAANKKFVVVDIETTGLSPNKGGRIIEIGAIKLNGESKLDSFSTFINPEMPIPKSSTEIHGITDEMVKDAPTFHQVLKDFKKFIGDDIIVAHNAKFDWDRFLLHYFRLLGIYPKNKVVDTMVLAKVVLPASPNDSMKLEEVCERCNVELEGAHRALNDAMATADIFIIAKRIIDKNTKISSSQQSILSVEEESFPKQKILYANYWEKSFKRGGTLVFMRRIYVGLTDGVVFYDLVNNSWQVKEAYARFDFEQIEKDFLKYVEKNNREVAWIFKDAKYTEEAMTN